MTSLASFLFWINIFTLVTIVMVTETMDKMRSTIIHTIKMKRARVKRSTIKPHPQITQQRQMNINIAKKDGIPVPIITL